MKKKILFLAAATFLATRLFAGDIVVNKYRYVGPFTVHQPYLVDSTDVNGKKYSEKLISGSSFNWSDAASTEMTMAADSTITLPAQNGAAVHVAYFYLNSSRYQKATLKVMAPEGSEVYVDGEKKELADGALSLTLTPKRYEIAVKCLTRNKAEKLKVLFNSPYENAAAITTDPSRIYTLHDVIEGRRILSGQLSPDGKKIAVSFVKTFPGGKTSRYMQILDVATQKVLYQSDSNIDDWLSDGNSFVLDRKGPEGDELVRHDLATNQETVIMKNMPSTQFVMSPNDDKAIFFIEENGPKERADLQQILNPEDRQPGWRDRSHLQLVDFKTGFSQQITYGYRNTSLIDWSKDGKYILFGYYTNRFTKRPFTLGTFCRMNMETFKVDTILCNSEFVSTMCFSPDDTKLLVQGTPEAFGGIGLNIDPGQKSNMSDEQLFIMDIDGKNVKAITKDFNPSINSSDWNGSDGQIYALVTDRDLVSIFRYDQKTGKFVNMNAKEEVVASYDIARHAPVMSYFGQSASNTQRLYVTDLKKGTSTCLIDLNPEILKDVKLGEVKPWSFVSALGDTIIGRFYLPPTFDANKQYPLIVNYYGGTLPTERSFESRYPEHTYSGQGYIYLVLEPSGATGFGQKFSARHVDAWGKYTGDEIIEGTKKFLAEHPYANPKKVGCIGASYGGFMTQYLMTKTDIFTAAISHAGISDVSSYWGEGYWGYSYNQTAAADSYPWTNRDLYTKDAPLFNADKVHTPILFLHGTDDTNVPIGESIQMFTALKLLGKTAEFVQVAGQNHHIMQYDKRLRWNDTIYAWFAKWLKDEPEWWDAMYPPKNL